MNSALTDAWLGSIAPCTRSLMKTLLPVLETIERNAPAGNWSVMAFMFYVLFRQDPSESAPITLYRDWGSDGCCVSRQLMLNLDDESLSTPPWLSSSGSRPQAVVWNFQPWLFTSKEKVEKKGLEWQAGLFFQIRVMRHRISKDFYPCIWSLSSLIALTTRSHGDLDLIRRRHLRDGGSIEWQWWRRYSVPLHQLGLLP